MALGKSIVRPGGTSRAASERVRRATAAERSASTQHPAPAPVLAPSTKDYAPQRAPLPPRPTKLLGARRSQRVLLPYVDATAVVRRLSGLIKIAWPADESGALYFCDSLAGAGPTSTGRR